ncbi:MAG: ATP-binding cassette domain-containing protein [Acidobacteriota bacterium]|nr:ATP-binding cassette domain-containing protein [Acidobacteriota bacterium]
MSVPRLTDNSIAIPAFSISGSRGKTLLDTEPFSLTRGETLAVAGPSGAGKSLFLRSLFGWVGKRRQGPLKTKDGACIMIQDPSRGLTPSLTLGGHFREIIEGPDWRERALTLCRSLGLQLPDLLKRKPSTLSGGERQRAMLALIMARRPGVLACDEPAASLDQENEQLVWDMVLNLKAEHHLTVIFVTHRLDLIHRFADHVLLLERGREAFFGDKDAFFNRPRSVLHRKMIHIYRLETTQPAAPPAKEGPPLLQVDGLNLDYGAGPIFRNFHWRAARGDWWWILGASGSGKTSLARVLCGLVPQARGHLTLEGKPLPIQLADRGSNRHRIQYLFQHGSMSLNPAFRVGRILRKAYKSRLDLLDHYLDVLGLAGLNLDRRPASFSMGERQRLNLVRTLANDPDILICDELFSSLDIASRYDLIELLARIQEETGLTVIAITHDRLLTHLKPGHLLDLERSGDGHQQRLSAIGQAKAEGA